MLKPPHIPGTPFFLHPAWYEAQHGTSAISVRSEHDEKLKLPEVFGLLRPGFLLLLRRSRFVGKEIQF
jgi:hypothetical protein